MSVWKTLPISEQPEIILDCWRIIELPNGDRHFNGYHYKNWEGRMSSKIVEFDPIHLVGRTRTGRVYRLNGPQGVNNDADYVFNCWLMLNDLPLEFKVLTEEELSLCSKIRESNIP